MSHRKFPVNETFFEEIDTEQKAYCLGFLFADGCNSGKRLEVSLAKQDRDILERISLLLLCGNINIKEYKSKKKGVQDRIGLYVVSKRLANSLIKWGCVPRKTFIVKFPDIPKCLCHHFIRGYFDGDGSITLNYKRRVNGEPSFSIVSTKEMLDAIGQRFTNLGVYYAINKRHKNRDNNNFTLRVSGKKQITKVCEYLYENATIFLKRKFETYQILRKAIYVY